MKDVDPLLKQKAECEGNPDKCKVEGCPLFGTLGRPAKDGKRRVRGCGDPVARGKRNRRKGQRVQAAVARTLGVPRTSFHPGHEETMPGNIRFEVKAGAQVRPVATAYNRARRQSETNAHVIGKMHLPFVLGVKADGEKTLIVLAAEDLLDFCVAYLEQNLPD